MLDLRLFADRMFRNANIVYFASSASLIGVLFLLPLFLQELRGFSAIETGFILFPSAVGVVVFAQLSGRLYPIVGPRRLLAVALSLFALSSGLLLFVDLRHERLVDRRDHVRPRHRDGVHLHPAAGRHLLDDQPRAHGPRVVAVQHEPPGRLVVRRRHPRDRPRRAHQQPYARDRRRPALRRPRSSTRNSSPITMPSSPLSSSASSGSPSLSSSTTRTLPLPCAQSPAPKQRRRAKAWSPAISVLLPSVHHNHIEFPRLPFPLREGAGG